MLNDKMEQIILSYITNNHDIKRIHVPAVRKFTLKNGTNIYLFPSCVTSFSRYEEFVEYDPEQLTELEWNNNEFRIDFDNAMSNFPVCVFTTILKIEKDLHNNFRGENFHIVASIDEGMNDVGASCTVRLYAIRNGYCYIDCNNNNLDKFDQPIIIRIVRT